MPVDQAQKSIPAPKADKPLIDAKGNPPPDNSNYLPYIRITPLTQLETDTSTAPSNRFSDAYTRLRVTSQVHEKKNNESTQGKAASDKIEKKESYPYKERNWLRRFFVGTRHTINLSTKVTVGTFMATVPLVTIEHVSNTTEGEAFTRIVNHVAQNYPLFLVRGDGSNSIASVQFCARASDEVQSSAAGKAIQVAQSVTQAVAPQSAVFTTLTQQSTKDVATALDKTISQMLAKSVREEQWVDNDIRRWVDGPKLTFAIPRNEGKWEEDDGGYITIGTWIVQFEDPRPSIFSDLQICRKETDAKENHCRADYKTAALEAQNDTAGKPEQVLQFKLLNGAENIGTVSSYLKQQDWWSTSLNDFAQTGVTPKPDTITQFCRSIKSTIAGLGLNSVDSGIVAVAVQKGAVLPKSVVAAMTSDQDCGWSVK